MEATDWNVVLNTEQKISDSLKYIGVRAHYFIPAIGEGQINTVAGTISHIIEDTFSFIVMVQCGSGKSGQIRWECSKNSFHGIKEPGQRIYLQILPKDILILME